MAEKFDEFIEEVEKDIRQEKLEQVWKEYGKAISTVVVVALGVSTIWLLWKNHAQKQLDLTSQKFVTAQQSLAAGNLNEGIGVFDSITHDSSKTYAALARIAKAAALYQKGGEDVKRSAETLKELASLKQADPIMRDYAALTLIRADIDTFDFEKIDEAAKAKLIGHLVSLDDLSKDDAPWRLSALELKGYILYGLKDYTKASESYVKIAHEKDCPSGFKVRAEIMSQIVLKKIQNQN